MTSQAPSPRDPGVAPSFASSTRFVLDPHLARSMFLRSRYILESLTELERFGRTGLPVDS